MALRVSFEDLELIGFDAGGGEILNYQGEPFTGIIEELKDGRLIGEVEFTNGHRGGVYRTYFDNGQLEEEYFLYFNKMEGNYREWDEDGNLISSTNWKDGEQIS